MENGASSEYTICSPEPEGAVSSVQVVASSEKTQIFATSWDSTIRLYEAQSGKMIYCLKNDESPILTACVTESLTYAYGGLSMKIYAGDLARPDALPILIGHHEAPVRCISAHDHKSIFSGSWDRSVKLWDLRSGIAATTITAEGKIFALATYSIGSPQRLVISDSLKNVYVYDCRKLKQPEYIRDSNNPVLKSQSRYVECFPDGSGYALASVEGRVAWEYHEALIDKESTMQSYAFKCHREKSNKDGKELIHPVNCLSFHRTLHGFATGGGDGAVIIWDGISKKRLWKTTESFKGCVTSLNFHPADPFLAIGISAGRDLMQPKSPGSIVLKKLRREEVASRAKLTVINS